jgi:anti-sigma regulatory factor (Ser/Thr protein kinase)
MAIEAFQKGSGSMQDDLFLTLPALAENLARVREAVGERAHAYGMSEAAIADLKTVVSEACANVVRHAYPEAEAPGPLEVGMTRESTGLRILIRDRGAGIRPLVKPRQASSKMGLLLIGALSTSFQLRSARDKGTELIASVPLVATAIAER